MPGGCGTQSIVALLLCAHRALACSLSALASCRPGLGSRCAVCLIAACEVLNTSTIVTLCVLSAYALVVEICSAILIAQSSALNTTMRLRSRLLQLMVQPSRLDSPLQLLLLHCPFRIHLFITSKCQIPQCCPFFLPIACQLSWPQHPLPVKWYWPLPPPQGLASAWSLLSCSMHALSRPVCVLVHHMCGKGRAPSTWSLCKCLVDLPRTVIWHRAPMPLV